MVADAGISTPMQTADLADFHARITPRAHRAGSVRQISRGERRLQSSNLPMPAPAVSRGFSVEPSERECGLRPRVLVLQ